MNKKELKIKQFLTSNGWELDLDSYSAKSEFWTYHNPGHISIDVSEKEIVFLDDTGDFHREKLNIYALIGFLICHRQITFSFKQP